jgi:esterase/lipase superfamily enzyme
MDELTLGVVVALVVAAVLVAGLGWALRSRWSRARGGGRDAPPKSLSLVLAAGVGIGIAVVAGGLATWLFTARQADDSYDPPWKAGNPAPIVVDPGGGGPPLSTGHDSPNTATIRVYFGTDRRSVEGGQASFADAPADEVGELATGWCTVSVPRNAHRIGEIERPTFWTLDVTNWFENADRHFVIVERPLVPGEAFWSALGTSVDRSPARQLLLFVHGYNVSFDDAVYRTAQLAFDLNFPGPPVLYSWPSNAATLRYVADKDHSLSTLGAFKRFLLDLSRRSGATTIHVIAHSMGNNALVHALAELALEHRDAAPRFREIIMAAPDVDRREYLRLADAFHSSASRVTLYAADNDRALGASETLHGDPRIGDARPMFVRQGLDSIDASLIIKGFLKHSYFADPRILGDIERLLIRQEPLPRFGLVAMPSTGQPAYWRFRP